MTEEHYRLPSGKVTTDTKSPLLGVTVRVLAPGEVADPRVLLGLAADARAGGSADADRAPGLVRGKGAMKVSSGRNTEKDQLIDDLVDDLRCSSDAEQYERLWQAFHKLSQSDLFLLISVLARRDKNRVKP